MSFENQEAIAEQLAQWMDTQQHLSEYIAEMNSATETTGNNHEGAGIF